MNLLKLLPTLAVVLMGIAVLRKAALFIIDYMTPHLNLTGSVPNCPAEVLAKALAEEEDISRFVAGFRMGPATPSPVSWELPADTISAPTPEITDGLDQKETDPLQKFFDHAPACMTGVRALVGSLGRSALGSDEGKASVREILGRVGMQIQILKHRASLPELRPAWQMASGLEGLLKQLTDRVGSITPSTIKTVAGAIDVLGGLCAPGVRADLATHPTIQVLVVDDDAVSRFTLAAAVKKVFNQPEFAENGETALTLAGQHAYDVIFLDVKMPGMDGFEVCSKIHETEANRSTPVVFVTGLNDFESRTTSVISGGSDLIAKPFLTFEIAVKALTLVLQNRLKMSHQVVEVFNANVPSTAPAPNPRVASQMAASAPSTRPARPLPTLAREELASSNPSISGAKSAPRVPQSFSARAASKAPGAPQPRPIGNPKTTVSAKLLAGVSASLAEMRYELASIGQTVDEAGQCEKWVVLHLCVQSLTRQLDLPELRPAFQLSFVLQGLLKKLQDKPAHATGTTLDTVTTAVGLLARLCQPGVKPDLATAPAISILVVDDEPLTRRAIVGALQTAFLKPESAENGEAALALAGKKRFDVIFLDVQMPGMDGFEVCSKIRETGANRATPVIFVTSHTDSKARADSARCGGTDFVVKPFLFVEINLKALTFALDGRLQRPVHQATAAGKPQRSG